VRSHAQECSHAQQMRRSLRNPVAKMCGSGSFRPQSPWQIMFATGCGLISLRFFRCCGRVSRSFCGVGRALNFVRQLSELSILCATSFGVCGASFSISYGSVAFTELEFFRGANGARVFISRVVVVLCLVCQCLLPISSSAFSGFAEARFHLAPSFHKPISDFATVHHLVEL